MAHCLRLTDFYNKLSKKQKIWGIVLISLIFCLILTLLLLRFLPYPELNDFLKNRKYSTRIYDCNGELVQILPLEQGLRREFVSLANIPEELQKAFIQAEDKRFNVHPGFSIFSLFRAALQNISSRKTVSGASTITMQLARIISPTPARNVLTKGLEIINALRLELRLSKKEILELYLNNVPFGFNTEGVNSAARLFFGKDIASLSTEEIYILSIIPRRPSLYNPLQNPKESAIQASKVFNVSANDIYAKIKNANSFHYQQKMPHYIEYLKQTGFLHYQKEDVTLSASLILHDYAASLLEDSLLRYQHSRITNGAILVANTQTGEILTWVGSGDFYNKENLGQNDGVLAKNQPGSSMKPFLYALALENGFNANTILPDIPTDFGSKELYIPQNFNNRFNGPVRFRVALASSLNIPAVYLLDKLGIDTYIQKLKNLEFNSITNIDYGLGLALGNAEVSLFELVQGFSVFPRDGVFLPLKPTVAEENTLAPKKVYSTEASRLICDILSDKQSRTLGFGYSQSFETQFSSMFKTGTANQYQNITALGATPLYTVGVWMGNFDGNTVIGRTGSSVPATIAKEILENMQTNDVPFKEVVGYKQAEICTLSGKLATSECKNTITEYVDSTELCDWHINGSVQYPPIYEQFLSLKNQNAFIAEQDSSIKIISPNDGSIFYYDSKLGNRQKLTVELIGVTDKEFSVTLIEKNSQKIVEYFELKGTNKFTLTPTKGDFTLIVTSINEQTSINYTVL